MFCNSCGNPNPDGSAFCMSCGKRLPVATPAPAYRPAAPRTDPVPAQVSRTKQVQAEFAKRFQAFWRDMVGSPLVLVFIILQTVQLISNLYTALTFSSIVDGMSYEMRRYFRDFDLDSATFLMFLFQTPAILTVIGMWVQYGESRSNGPGNRINTTGLSLIRGATIANVATLGLALIILLFSSCVAMEASSGSRNVGSYLFFTVLLVGGFAIFYSYLLLSVVSNTKDAAESHYPNTDKIVVLAVFQFIAAGSLLFLIFAGGQLSWSTLLSLGTTALSGAVLLTLKSTMDSLLNVRAKMEREAREAERAAGQSRPGYPRQPNRSQVGSRPAAAPRPAPAPAPAPAPVAVDEKPAVPAPAVVDEKPDESAPTTIDKKPDEPAPATVDEKPAVTVCSCGTENTGDWAFCPKCGKPFADQ